MKKIKFLLFASLAFSMILLTSVDATAQAKKDFSKMRKQNFKKIELKQDIGARATPTLKSNDEARAEKLAAAKAKQQERAANRGEKQTRPAGKITKMSENMSAKVKARRGIVSENTIKLKSTTPKAQLKTPQRDVEAMKQKRQARIAELRKKMRNQ